MARKKSSRARKKAVARARTTVCAGAYEFVGGAWVHERAKVADDVELAPGAVIGADVEVGPGSRVGPHAVILGPTVLGRENRVHAGAVLGDAPQDTSYQDEPTRLEVGDRNIFREGVTIHRGSVKGGGLTRIGNGNFLMADTHIGHDCVVEDSCVLANDVMVAGHSRIESFVNFGGGVALHQFCTVGRNAFVSGRSLIRTDAEPFLYHDRSSERRAGAPLSINTVGLSRGGFSEDVIARLKRAHREIFRRKAGGGADALRAHLEEADAWCDEVAELCDFIARKAGGRYGRQLEPTR